MCKQALDVQSRAEKGTFILKCRLHHHYGAFLILFVLGSYRVPRTDQDWFGTSRIKRVKARILGEGIVEPKRMNQISCWLLFLCTLFLSGTLLLFVLTFNFISGVALSPQTNFILFIWWVAEHRGHQTQQSLIVHPVCPTSAT